MTKNTEALRFLAALDPTTDQFTFQTFDDDKDRKDNKLAQVFNGTFAQHEKKLTELSKRGAGVFVTVNETDLKGRKVANIKRVRALFVDLDGIPLKKVLGDKELPSPQIVVESSPDKWHCYWLVEPGLIELSKFTDLQKSLIAKFKSDKSIHDLPRVLRLPGFLHQKTKPSFMVRIESISDDAAYDSFPLIAAVESEFVEEYIPDHLRNAHAEGRGTIEAEEQLNKYRQLEKEAFENLDKWVPALFKGKAVKGSNGIYRVSSKVLGRKLEEDLSISKEGIKDFGVADMGDPREGKRTPIELVAEYSEACAKIEEGAERYNVAYVTLARRLGHEIPDEPDILEIQIKDGEIARCVDDTQRAILKIKRPVYVRAGNLVEPIWTEYPTQNGSKFDVTIFRAMGIENLRYMLNKNNIRYVRWDNKSKKLVPLDPPDKVMATMVKIGYWKFQKVSGIVNSPTMRPDGSILTERGYDEATQLWCWPSRSLVMPELKKHPTKKDAIEALALLKDLLSGFSFKEDLDLSVALAGILTAVLRGAFDIAPMFLFLAHMAGTGKSYLVDLVSTIVRGRPCPVITASRNEEEMEKRIGSLLIESTPMISIDNLSFDLKSDLLCQMCTQQTVKVRVLGKSETPDCEWKGTLFATGNNVNLSGDMTRRGLICNLDAGMERPELKEYEFSPIDRVLKDQGAYINAVLTIARAYYLSGQKANCGKIGSYGAWSKFVREPLIWLGEEDCTKSMEQAYENDPNKDAAERFMMQWKEHLGTSESFKLAEIIEKAKETRPSAVMGVGMNDWEHVRPDLFEVLVERAGDRGQIDPRRFAGWLKSLKGQIYSGHRIVIFQKDASNGSRWRLEPMKAKNSAH